MALGNSKAHPGRLRHKRHRDRRGEGNVLDAKDADTHAGDAQGVASDNARRFDLDKGRVAKTIGGQDVAQRIDKFQRPFKEQFYPFGAHVGLLAIAGFEGEFGNLHRQDFDKVERKVTQPPLDLHGATATVARHTQRRFQDQLGIFGKAGLVSFGFEERLKVLDRRFPEIARLHAVGQLAGEHDRRFDTHRRVQQPLRREIVGVEIPRIKGDAGHVENIFDGNAAQQLRLGKERRVDLPLLDLIDTAHRADDAGEAVDPHVRFGNATRLVRRKVQLHRLGELDKDFGLGIGAGQAVL